MAKSNRGLGILVSLNEVETYFLTSLSHSGLPKTELHDGFKKMLNAVLKKQQEDLRNSLNSKKFTDILYRINFFLDQLIPLLVQCRLNATEEEKKLLIEIAQTLRKNFKINLKIAVQSKYKKKEILGLTELIYPHILLIDSYLGKTLIEQKKYQAAESYIIEALETTYKTPYDYVEQIHLNRANLYILLGQIASQQNNLIDTDRHLEKAIKYLTKINKQLTAFYDLATRLGVQYRLQKNHQKAIYWFMKALKHDVSNKKNINYQKMLDQEIVAVKDEIQKIITQYTSAGFKAEIHGNNVVIIFTSDEFHPTRRDGTKKLDWSWDIININLIEFTKELTNLQQQYQIHLANKAICGKRATDETATPTTSVQVPTSDKSTTEDISLKEEKATKPRSRNNCNNNNAVPDDEEVKVKIEIPIEKIDLGSEFKDKTIYPLYSKYSNARFFCFYSRQTINAQTKALTDDDHTQNEAELAKEKIGETIRYVRGKNDPTFKIARKGADIRIFSNVAKVIEDKDHRKTYVLDFNEVHDHTSQVEKHKK